MLATVKTRSLQIFQRFGYSLLPATCIVCQLPAGRAMDLCAECEIHLHNDAPRCTQCALPLGSAPTTVFCGQCLQKPPPFTRTLCLGDYLPPLDGLLNDLKFNHHLAGAKVLGNLFADKIQRAYANRILPQCIIPIPLHKQRLRERGFNQAIELGRIMSKQLQLPLKIGNVKRRRNTSPQRILTAIERRKNLRAAFVVGNVQADYVALLDDVMTTGTTVRELSCALLKAGVKRVDVWCVARTFLK